MTHSTTLSAALTEIRELHAPLVAAAVAWQSDVRARRTEPDHFALICVAADKSARPGLSPRRWRRTDVFHLLRTTVPQWCSLARCPCPLQLPEALWQWFDFLDDTGGFAAGSDPLAELRKPLQCYGGLDPHGVRLPPGVPSSVPCECLEPYEEAA
jgi:hypothetical protein